MNPLTLFLILPFFTQFLEVEPARPKVLGKPRFPNSQISVMGFVYCDFCSNNSFSRHSYFLPGAEVKVDCMFKAISTKTTEQITLSVNRTTNKYGMYRIEVPSVDGVRCAEGTEVMSSCQANLIGSSTTACNVPGYKSTANVISVKARKTNLCIYSLNALNFRPSKKDTGLCGN